MKLICIFILIFIQKETTRGKWEWTRCPQVCKLEEKWKYNWRSKVLYKNSCIKGKKWIVTSSVGRYEKRTLQICKKVTFGMHIQMQGDKEFCESNSHLKHKCHCYFRKRNMACIHLRKTIENWWWMDKIYDIISMAICERCVHLTETPVCRVRIVMYWKKQKVVLQYCFTSKFYHQVPFLIQCDTLADRPMVQIWGEGRVGKSGVRTMH